MDRLNPDTKKPGVVSPGFDLVGVSSGSVYPMSQIVAAGTIPVLQQHAQRQPLPNVTIS